MSGIPDPPIQSIAELRIGDLITWEMSHKIRRGEPYARLGVVVWLSVRGDGVNLNYVSIFALDDSASGFHRNVAYRSDVGEVIS